MLPRVETSAFRQHVNCDEWQIYFILFNGEMKENNRFYTDDYVNVPDDQEHKTRNKCAAFYPEKLEKLTLRSSKIWCNASGDNLGKSKITVSCHLLKFCCIIRIVKRNCIKILYKYKTTSLGIFSVWISFFKLLNRTLYTNVFFTNKFGTYIIQDLIKYANQIVDGLSIKNQETREKCLKISASVLTIWYLK